MTSTAAWPPPMPSAPSSGDARPDSFGARLVAVMAERGPLCVGIDPHPELLAAWGLPDAPAGLAAFGETVVAALGERVAALKPQSAFYERHGSRGVAVLEHTIAAAREAGALVVVDAKRGDIGSTARAYATAYLDPASPLCGDAVTASPYLGVGALRPLVDTALASGTGLFILALTSNPEGAAVQRAVGPDGRTVAHGVLDAVAAVNAGAVPLGSIGVVVGATTVDPGGYDLAGINGPVLAPGFGAQGATAADLRARFGGARARVLPVSARAVLGAGPDPDALRRAAAAAVEEVREALVE